ncbi:MAG: hypothetical protein ACLFNM_03405 [Candidatus Woesearchaeota archaeon]
MNQETLFEKIYFNDYSTLQENERVIVNQGSTSLRTGSLVSGLITKITPIKGSKIINIQLTDTRDEYKKEENKYCECKEGNPGNIMYKVSKNILQGETSFLELINKAITSEKSEDDLKYVCSHLDEAIKHSELNYLLFK